MAQEFSDESQQALTGFFTQRIEHEKRSQLFSSCHLIDPWIQKCAACDTPRRETTTHSLGGILLGEAMVYDPYPVCLCGTCEEEIQSLLSHQTLGIWDDFVQTNFDCPPGQQLDLPTRDRPALF